MYRPSEQEILEAQENNERVRRLSAVNFPATESGGESGGGSGGGRRQSVAESVTGLLSRRRKSAV